MSAEEHPATGDVPGEGPMKRRGGGQGRGGVGVKGGVGRGSREGQGSREGRGSREGWGGGQDGSWRRLVEACQQKSIRLQETYQVRGQRRGGAGVKGGVEQGSKEGWGGGEGRGDDSWHPTRRRTR